MPNHEKTPEEIQLEIARTRSAITGDLLALSEKLSPAHLRESAREVMRDAREEAKEVLREAKDAAIDSLRGVKDRAFESVNDTVHDLSMRTRQAGGTALAFASTHPTALSLLGLGAGVLLWALRARRREPQYANSFAYDREYREIRRPSPNVDLDSLPRNVRYADQAAPRNELRAPPAPARSGGSRVAVFGLVVAAGLGIGLLLPIQKQRRAAR
jgi:ElaB/YqjD/DUF883 family membrane-anchored ribosome-binding protein